MGSFSGALLSLFKKKIRNHKERFAIVENESGLLSPYDEHIKGCARGNMWWIENVGLSGDKRSHSRCGYVVAFSLEKTHDMSITWAIVSRDLN